MAISVFPAAVTSTVNGFAATATNKFITYVLTRNVSSGVYTVTTSPPATNATILFYNGTTLVTTAVTVSGTVQVNLSQNCDKLWINCDDNSTIVSFVQTAAAVVVNGLSGTLDTITTTSTYNQTGQLYIVAVGGGGGGTDGFASNAPGGGGGGGALASHIGVVNTSTSITIGAAGNRGNPGNAGGSTSFGNLAVATGGNGATATSSNTNSSTGGNSGNVRTGGSTAVSDPSRFGDAGIAVPNPHLSVTTGTNGGGGGGSFTGNNNSNGTGGAGGGSGIGTGGAGSDSGPAASNAAAGNATGYGAGGGGGRNWSLATNNKATLGGNGSPGVVYVLRGF
jgi:hypothetical protein